MRKPFTKEEISKNMGELSHEVDKAINGLISKGLLKIVGQDEVGNDLYECTEFGIAVGEHMEADPKNRN